MSSKPEESQDSTANEGEKQEAEVKEQQEKNEQAKKPVEFFKKREEKRSKMAEELAARDAKIQALEAKIESLAKAKSVESESDDEYAEKGQKFDPSALANQVKESLLQEFKEANHKQFLADSAQKASEWLLGKDHIREDQSFANEVAEVIRRDHSDIADVNPMKAAKLAYADVCAARGVAPDMSNSNRGAYAGQGLKGGGGTKTSAKWTPEKAKAYLSEANPGTAEYAKRLATLEKELSGA